jgi:hypothetical protein
VPCLLPDDRARQAVPYWRRADDAEDRAEINEQIRKGKVVVVTNRE